MASDGLRQKTSAVQEFTAVAIGLMGWGKKLKEIIRV